MSAPALTLAPTASIRFCEDVTRRRARNFWYGIRLLPTAKRRALAAVYAMSRRIDDVGDGDLPLAAKRAELDRIERCLSGVVPNARDPVLAALAQAAATFPLPMEAFHDLVAGVRMDLDHAGFSRFEDLLPYCRRVAGSVGRLSLAVFGIPSGEAARADGLADDLGVAMQLTNIIRDVREDLARGRVYLPADDLDRFGCSADDLARPATAATAALIRFEVERARSWFRRGLELLPLLDRRSAACAGAMAGIYTRLLERIREAPGEVLRRRVSLSGGEKAWVAARALAGAAP